MKTALRILIGVVVALCGAVVFFEANRLPLFPAAALPGSALIVLGWKLVVPPQGCPDGRSRLHDYLRSLFAFVLCLGGAMVLLMAQNRGEIGLSVCGGGALLAGIWLARKGLRGRAPLIKDHRPG